MCIYIYLGVSKNRGTPKWMVENNGKPYFLMDDLVGKPTIFGNIHIYFNHINPYTSHSIPCHPYPFWPLKGGCCWCHRWCGIGIDAFFRSRVANGSAAWLSGRLTKNRIRRIWCWKATTFTLPKTNIAPENGWLKYYFPFGMAYFQGILYVCFREGIHHVLW